MMIERRSLPADSIRFAAGSRRLEGIAARFDTRAELGGGITESIAPGAFSASLASGNDILALADHDPTAVLGRTRSGTLTLAQDEAGLRFALDLPDTARARDILALVERGDIGGMSFGFRVPPGGDRWSGTHRELRSIDLREISIVSAWPAYPETKVVARSAPMSRAKARLITEIL